MRGGSLQESKGGRSKRGCGEEAGGFSVACRRANSCAGVGAPQLRRGSDIQIWAGLPCGLGDTPQPAPPPALFRAREEPWDGVKKGD